MPKPRKNQEELEKSKQKKLANLRPQKAGEPSHNPKGRPEGSRNFKTILGEMFAVLADPEAKHDLAAINPKIKTNEDLFAAKILYDALNGDATSKNIILDRYYGKLTDKVEHEGNINLGLTPEMEIAVKILNERNRNKE